MNYDLAKELKNAGFPYKEGDGYILVNGRRVGDMWQGEGQESACKVPTLAELIEACKDEYDSYSSFALECNGGTNWSASVGHMDRITRKGSTPEEAVARLWLALNKTNHI